MGKKAMPEDAPAGAPEWIVTFSDMVSLLVTFFVMLMSFSSIGDNESMVIMEAFNNARGGVIENPNGPDAVEPPAKDRMSAAHTMRGSSTPHSRPDKELQSNLEEMGQKLSAEHRALDLTKAVDGLRLQFGPESSFGVDSAALPPALTESLGEIARVLEHYDHLVVVEGFSDEPFRASARFPTVEALSTARAAAAARSMLEQSNLSPDVVQIAGLGSARPVGDNDLASGRALNRRVEVRVLSLSKSRAAQLEREREQRRGQGQ